MNNKLLVVLTGPTAVGKTSVSVELARKLETEIISADSRQIYQELEIGTAVPSMEERKGIKHHFIQCLSVFDYYNASMYEQDVLALLERLFNKYDLVILTGGSGLYVDAVCKGIDDLPGIDMNVRERLHEIYEKEGIESLRQQLKVVDPDHYYQVDLKNHKRILKALEIFEMTGKPYSSFLTRPCKKRSFDIIKTALNLPREELYQRINRRVDQMVERGLVDEARRVYHIYKKKKINALNTVGYKELFRCFEEEKPLEEGIQQIKNDTRKYARKQITWIKRDSDVKWFEPSEIYQLEQYINSKI